VEIVEELNARLSQTSMVVALETPKAFMVLVEKIA